MISIIVPIYNIENYLVTCIESIVQQTFLDIEIVLVDDGSTDGSLGICRHYSKLDPRITVVEKENGGLVSARKAGLKAAKGEYIAFVDGDDWVEPDMYERMYRKMKEQAVDVVICGHYEDTGSSRTKVFHGARVGRYGKRGLLKEIYPQMVIDDTFIDLSLIPLVWDKLFRRECVEKFVYAVDERITMGEDAACIYPFILNVDSVFVMDECLYHYRQTPFSMVKKIPDQREECERFQVLYQTVDESLGRSVRIYDLRPQWKKFMLFMMVPRADALYQGYSELGYLFPFPKVKKGFRIALYCAGTYGQRLYRYLERTEFCRVVAWVDRNHLQLREMGLPVEDPKVLQDREYDAIVIANMFDKPKKTLYDELSARYPKEKIHLPDRALIFSSETLQAFGLI